MKIIIHCSDSTWGNAAIITKWHVLPKPKGNGWSNIGYHYVILNGFISPKAFNKFFDGHCETGRPLDDDGLLRPYEYGAHTKGLNDGSVSICLIGKNGNFTDNQMMELEQRLIGFRQQFDKLEISQHSDWDRDKPHCAGLCKDYMQELNELYG